MFIRGTQPETGFRVLGVGVVGPGSVTIAPAGITCSARCTVRLRVGTRAVVTAEPDDDSMFVGWWGPTCQGTKPTCSFLLDGDRFVGADFSERRELRVSMSGPGSVTSEPAGIRCPARCTAEFRDYTTVVLTAKPAAGSTFKGWSGDCAGTSSTCWLLLKADRDVGATFG